MHIGMWEMMLIALVVILLFGSGKISGLMGDVAKGIKAFKRGIADDEPRPATADTPTGQIPPPAPVVAQPAPAAPAPPTAPSSGPVAGR